MAFPSSHLPEWVLQDGRWAYTGFDSNNNLIAWPINAAIAASATMTGVATHTVTQGFEASSSGAASFNYLSVVYNDVWYFMMPQTGTAMPNAVYTVLAAASPNYVVTTP